MNDRVQMVIVIVAVAVAVLYFARHIYLMAKKKGSCGGCNETKGCAGCPAHRRCHDGDRRPPYCR